MYVMYQYDSTSYPVIALITSLLLESLNYHIQTSAMLPRWWSMVRGGARCGVKVSVDVVGLYPDNTDMCRYLTCVPSDTSTQHRVELGQRGQTDHLRWR